MLAPGIHPVTNLIEMIQKRKECIVFQLFFFFFGINYY